MAFCAKNGDSDLAFFCGGYLYLTFATAVSYKRGVHQPIARFDKIFGLSWSLQPLHSSAAGRQRAIYQNVNHFPAFALCATFKAIDIEYHH